MRWWDGWHKAKDPAPAPRVHLWPILHHRRRVRCLSETHYHPDHGDVPSPELRVLFLFSSLLFAKTSQTCVPSTLGTTIEPKAQGSSGEFLAKATISKIGGFGEVWGSPSVPLKSNHIGILETALELALRPLYLVVFFCGLSRMNKSIQGSRTISLPQNRKL